jgi:hypothetical protein
MNVSLKIHSYARNPQMTWLKAIELLDVTTKTKDEKEFRGNQRNCFEPKRQKNEDLNSLRKPCFPC